MKSFSSLILLAFLITPGSLAIAQASKTASSDWDRQINALVNQIDAEIPTQTDRVKIAVVDFSDLQGRVTNFGRFLSEELITRLFRLKKFTVVERLLLENVIKENALQLTGMVAARR